MQTIAVIDFETTGMAPSGGARATEIAAVLVRDGRIVDRYQNLMHTGAWVSPFIERLTGISNRMLERAPPAAQVMREVADFTAGCGLVAHNAAFDRGFWQAEAARAEVDELAHWSAPAERFACTVLLSRRLYPEAPNHQLGTLARWHALPSSGRAHRALADAEVTAHLLLRMQDDLRQRFGAELADAEPDHRMLVALQRADRGRLGPCIARGAGAVRQQAAPA